MATVMKRLRGGKGQPSVLRLLEIIILSTMTLFLSAFYINYLLKGAYYTLYSVLFGVSAIVYLLILIYFYLKYPKRKEVMDSDEESLVIPRLFCEEDKFDDVIQRKLFELFEKDKPYLSPDITIGEVAFRLFTNKLYLSKILNLKIDKNFREFVNYYRVREAMELFINNPTISITDLCGLCGFRNVASFTNAFKIHSGYTPGEWCRQIKNRVQCEREEKYVVQT